MAGELIQKLFLCLSFLLVGVETVKECTKIDDCSCRKSNGKTMSLKQIDGKSGPKFTGIKEISKDGKIQPYTFRWNPCTKFSVQAPAGCADVLLCQLSNDGKVSYPVGKTVESFTEGGDGSIILTYTGVVYDQYTRKGVIILKCDEKETPGKLTEFIEQKNPSTSSSQYTSTFTSKCVCDGGCPDAPGGSEELSTGSILLIVFFPLVFIYFIAGLLYNKYHKGAETFPEMVPNHSFWSDFPFLVKDGCVFTFQTVAGCCKSLCRKIQGDSYAKI